VQRSDLWEETKYRIIGGKVRSSKDPIELARSSRIIADLVAEFYARAIPRWASGDLADLGCGKAPLLGIYRNYCASITLADWANSTHENPLLDLVIDMNEPLRQIASNSFDTVLLSDVLEHISEPANLIGEIARILKPGGRLILNVPFMYPVHEGPHDYYRYTRFALERFVGRSDLDVVEVVPLGGWLELIGDVMSKFFASLGLWFVIPVLHRVVMTSHCKPWSKLLANRGRELVPLGYGMIAQKPTMRTLG
jgi:SAM-dependent methyltransferase